MSKASVVETISTEADGFGFAIDTEAYAGSFERETVAHMTGQFGECEVGDDVAAAAIKSLRKTAEGKRFLKWCEAHVAHKFDDGCQRPASILKTPGLKESQTVVCWLDCRPPAWVVNIFKARAVDWLGTKREFHEPVAVTGYRVIEMAITTRSTAV